MLKSLDMADVTSSLHVYAHDFEHGGDLILFQHHRYQGRYAMFPCKPGGTMSTPELSSLNFNNLTSSVLLVRRFKVECPPLPIKEIVADWKRIGLIALHNNEIYGYSSDYTGYGLVSHYVDRRGDPIISWDMWPSFSPTQTFLYVRVPTKFWSDLWPIHDCEIRYWIYFYIDGGGTLRGYVAYYGAWVASGIRTERILDILMEITRRTLHDMNDLILEAVTPWNTLRFERLYYLPGTADGIGHVDDDVSLVLVKEV